eukprot:13297722-Alexandrium_andersonii.AAC.1
MGSRRPATSPRSRSAQEPLAHNLYPRARGVAPAKSTVAECASCERPPVYTLRQPPSASVEQLRQGLHVGLS